MTDTAKSLNKRVPVQTLPSHVYTDPSIYNDELRAIFARTWQYVGHIEKLRDPGDFIVVDVVGESILIVRDKQGDLTAFYNVCVHRAARLLSGEGCKQRFACPYHGWTYDTSGALIAAPNAKNVDGFELGDYRLKSCRVEEMHGLVFVNLDQGAAPLSEFSGGLEAEFREYAPQLPVLTFVHRTEATLACNWKVAAENFSECYHCTLVHKEFTQGIVDPDSYHVKVNGNWHKHLSKTRADGKKVYDYDAEKSSHANEFGAWWMWPNFAFQSYPGGAVHVWKWTPLSVDKTHVAVDWYFPSNKIEPWEQELIDHHARTTFAEDIPLVESVQLGLASRSYDRGPLMQDAAGSVLSEHAVLSIQNLWRESMGDESITAG